jgi:hypothetical protein
MCQANNTIIFCRIQLPSRIDYAGNDVEIRGFIPAISTSSPEQQMGEAVLAESDFSLKTYQPVATYLEWFDLG